MRRFVGWAAPLRARSRVPFVAFMSAALLGGCAPSSHPRRTEVSLTGGHIRIVCAPESRAIIESAATTFEGLYPEAHIEVQTGTSRDAIAALFAARADLAVITRELLPEERAAATRGKLALEGYRFARDALVMLVSSNQPVENVAVEDVRRIYRGEIKDWRGIGGRAGAIVPLVQAPSSDLTEFFSEEIMGGEPVRAPAMTFKSDSAVANYVRDHETAIGYASLSAKAPGVRMLRVAALTGLPYWKPDAETVYRGDYPITRFYNMYVRTSGPPLANGFITFVTSIDGQKLVHGAGLVPTNVPIRFVRRSPMLSTHSQGDSLPRP